MVLTTRIKRYHPIVGLFLRAHVHSDLQFEAPLFEKGIQLELDETMKNETIWGSNETTSIYIQDPSPEVDAAWDFISADSSSIISISRAEAEALGRDPEVIVKSPEDWELGDDSYPAQIDVFHEIHCLNMLRKEMVSSISILRTSRYSFFRHSTGTTTTAPSSAILQTHTTCMFATSDIVSELSSGHSCATPTSTS